MQQTPKTELDVAVQHGGEDGENQSRARCYVGDEPYLRIHYDIWYSTLQRQLIIDEK